MSSEIKVPRLILKDGERIQSVYWAATHHYGFTPFDTQEEAEQHARLHPTSTEVLSYADRTRGVTPSGKGWVALRVVISSFFGSIDTELMRYPVTVDRHDPEEV